MANFARGGPLAAGSGACIFSICLLSNLGLCQTESIVSEPDEGREANSFLSQQSQEQHQAVLKAIAEIQLEVKTAFNVHRQDLATEIDFLKRDVASGREQDLDLMQHLHRDTRTVMLTVGGTATFVLLLNAVILFWGMNGISARLTAMFELRPLSSSRMETLTEAQKAAALDEPAVQTRIVQIIERLDRRLLELETRTTVKNLANDLAIPKPTVAPTQVASVASTSSAKVPRVSITLGEGSAIGFLPSAVGAMKWQAWWSRMQKWKKRGKRSRAS
jgi:hypothetical protein